MSVPSDLDAAAAREAGALPTTAAAASPDPGGRLAARAPAGCDGAAASEAKSQEQHTRLPSGGPATRTRRGAGATSSGGARSEGGGRSTDTTPRLPPIITGRSGGGGGAPRTAPSTTKSGGSGGGGDKGALPSPDLTAGTVRGTSSSLTSIDRTPVETFSEPSTPFSPATVRHRQADPQPCRGNKPREMPLPAAPLLPPTSSHCCRRPRFGGSKGSFFTWQCGLLTSSLWPA